MKLTFVEILIYTLYKLNKQHILMIFDIQMIREVYKQLPEKIKKAQKNWLKNYRNKCSDNDACLEKEYLSKIAATKAPELPTP